jgi:hypothetical protein
VFEKLFNPSTRGQKFWSYLFVQAALRDGASRRTRKIFWFKTLWASASGFYLWYINNQLNKQLAKAQDSVIFYMSAEDRAKAELAAVLSMLTPEQHRWHSTLQFEK